MYPTSLVQYTNVVTLGIHNFKEIFIKIEHYNQVSYTTEITLDNLGKEAIM